MSFSGPRDEDGLDAAAVGEQAARWTALRFVGVFLNLLRFRFLFLLCMYVCLFVCAVVSVHFFTSVAALAAE